jgi:uncharacterized radical SAM superfamily Fe-S cluster-containing enzyme
MGHILKAVNGITIKNLRHLVETLHAANGEFIVFSFEGRGEETLVFPRAKMLDITEGILGDNGIREQGSKDLMDAWAAH